MFDFSTPVFGNPMYHNQNDNITIEVQDTSGNWRVNSVTLNNGAYILSEMTAAQSFHNGARVRAVDSQNMIVNIL